MPTIDAPSRPRHHERIAASTSPIRVLVVDDQPTFRDGMRALLAAIDGFEWVGSATCGEDAVEQTERLRPDLVLMDVRMPGIGGIEAARQIAARGLPALVMLMTAADLPGDGRSGTATGPTRKRDLTPTFLRRLREDLIPTDGTHTGGPANPPIPKTQTG